MVEWHIYNFLLFSNLLICPKYYIVLIFNYILWIYFQIIYYKKININQMIFILNKLNIKDLFLFFYIDIQKIYNIIKFIYNNCSI